MRARARAHAHVHVRGQRDFGLCDLRIPSCSLQPAALGGSVLERLHHRLGGGRRTNVSKTQRRTKEAETFVVLLLLVDSRAATQRTPAPISVLRHLGHADLDEEASAAEGVHLGHVGAVTKAVGLQV